MQEELSRDPLTPGECELEKALRSLRPAAPVFDADALAFGLGRRSQVRRLRAWQACAAVLAAGLIVAVVGRPSGPARVPVAPAHAVGGWLDGAPDTRAYLRLRDAVLERGLDALSVASEGDLAPARLDDVLRITTPRRPEPGGMLPWLGIGGPS